MKIFNYLLDDTGIAFIKEEEMNTLEKIKEKGKPLSIFSRIKIGGPMHTDLCHLRDLKRSFFKRLKFLFITS